MFGAYEWSEQQDNDPDDSAWLAGWSEEDRADDPTNFVFQETVRDLWNEPEVPGMVPYGTFLDRVAAHEALHRFFGWHGTDQAADEGIMDGDVLMTQAAVSLTSRQIRVVQARSYPR